MDRCKLTSNSMTTVMKQQSIHHSESLASDDRNNPFFAIGQGGPLNCSEPRTDSRAAKRLQTDLGAMAMTKDKMSPPACIGHQNPRQHSIGPHGVRSSFRYYT
jgi:hypothetical protein